MAGDATTNNKNISNIRQEYNLGRVGLDMDSTVNQIQKGSYFINFARLN